MPLSVYKRPQDAHVFPARGRRVSLIVYARHRLGSLAGICFVLRTIQKRRKKAYPVGKNKTGKETKGKPMENAKDRVFILFVCCKVCNNPGTLYEKSLIGFTLWWFAQETA